MPVTWWPDSGHTTQSRAEVALAIRLRTVMPLLTGGAADLPALPDPAADAARTLDHLITAVSADPTNERIWLLLAALSAAYPVRGDVDQLRRQLELVPHRAAMIVTLEQSAAILADVGEPEALIEVLTGEVVVDVDHCAKYELHTGIQRVVRSLLPIWNREHRIVAAAWDKPYGALRGLEPDETERVLDWFDRPAPPAGEPDGGKVAEGVRDGGQDGPPPDDEPPPFSRIIVPWRSIVVMPEVPPGEVSDRLAALASYSGNRLVGVIHDAIPVVSADMVPTVDSSKFVRYLTCAKFAARLAGVSNSATAEIAGFVHALRTQGLPGPVVSEVPLGSPIHPPPDVRAHAGPASVLVVGSHEPRKNHLAILHSAEILWREGLRFTLTFVGGSGWGDDFPHRVAQLRRAGRPIAIRHAISERELDTAYRTAWFTVFPSLHEGFGLPVAESIAHGTPVITSDFGSTAQTGAAGGTILIDPRDDDALTAAMRTLLTDPSALAELREQIRRRPHRSWQDYGTELWDVLVEPELAWLQGRTS